MKVAMIDPSLFTLPYDRALAAALRRRGHEVPVFGRPLTAAEGVLPDGIRPDFYRDAAGRRAAALTGGLRRVLKGASHVLSMVRLARELESWRPDVIHFQWLPLPAVDGLFLSGLGRLAPLVLTVHDTNPFNGNPGARVQRLGACAILKRFDMLVVHTRQGRDRLIARGLPADAIACLGHGPLHDHGPAAPATDAAGMPLDILLFGKLKPYKGADVLLRAFALLPREVQARARVRIVGEPCMDTAGLEALARDLGIDDRVVFEWRIVPEAEIPALLASAAIMAFPYREIEVSGVLMAAIPAGRPVAASRLGGFAELLRDGEHGFLVEPDAPDALAGALGRLITDSALRRRCGTAMAAIADTVPGWDAIAAATEALYTHAHARAELTRRHPPAPPPSPVAEPAATAEEIAEPSVS